MNIKLSSLCCWQCLIKRFTRKQKRHQNAKRIMMGGCDVSFWIGRCEFLNWNLLPIGLLAWMNLWTRMNWHIVRAVVSWTLQYQLYVSTNETCRPMKRQNDRNPNLEHCDSDLPEEYDVHRDHKHTRCSHAKLQENRETKQQRDKTTERQNNREERVHKVRRSPIFIWSHEILTHIYTHSECAYTNTEHARSTPFRM